MIKVYAIRKNSFSRSYTKQTSRLLASAARQQFASLDIQSAAALGLVTCRLLATW
jgi:hypothetical protein